MHHARLRVIGCVGLGLAVPSTASAGIVANWVSVPISPAAVAADPVLANMQSWSLQATTDGDWGAAGFEAILPAGNSFYNPALGGNTKPNPAIVAAFPNIAYDTYVTAPGDTGATGAPIILGPFPPGSGSGGVGGRFAVTWGDFALDAPGTYEILRMTFPNSVLPNVNQISYTAQINPTSAGPAGINLGSTRPIRSRTGCPTPTGTGTSRATGRATGCPRCASASSSMSAARRCARSPTQPATPSCTSCAASSASSSPAARSPVTSRKSTASC